MKTTIAFLFAAFAICAAGPAAQQPAGKTAPKAAPAPPAGAGALKPLEIPAGAVETQPGFYSYTDPAGKKWIYRGTPFGMTRWEDKPADAAKSTPFEDSTKSFEQGDAVRFERATPFGVAKWVKKKSDLDDEERFIWERDKTQADKSKQDKK
jgi:hypothetical protein